MHVDLSTVVEQLKEALEEADTLNASPYEDDGKNSPYNRQMRDRLLYLADSLQLASSLVRAEYWEGRQR